jgi:SpoVK/Ycf46/Vps4 family AAA+-type ATPase
MGRSAWECLLSALERLDRRLERAVASAKAAYGPEAAADPYRGLYISQHEAERWLADEPLLSGLWTKGQVIEEPLADGDCPELRLGLLKQAFHLSALDLDALLVALAPELDLRYERLYAYLQDDVTKKRPSVDLVLSLLCPSFEAKLAARSRFTPSAPLLKHQLLQVFDDPSHPPSPLLSRYLKVDERIVNYLLGSDEPDERLLPYLPGIGPPARLADLLLPADLRQRLARLAQEQTVCEEGIILYFQGPDGVGKKTVAAALGRELGIGLLAFDGECLLEAEDRAFETLLRLAGRETRLQGSALYWDGFDALLADAKRTQREVLMRALEERRGLAFLAGNAVWEPDSALHRVPFVRIEFPLPTYAERVQLWERALNGAQEPEVELEALANKFRFTGGQIRNAAATAHHLARWRDPEHGQVTTADLYAASRLHSNRKLAALAHKVAPHYSWDDIILPADRLQQLRDICHHIRYRALVYDTWGFDHKLALGKGLNVLFAGPSGTGKTMAAEIMAAGLGLDLYKIDLSTVVSKYIGETEKNLASIFAEAETSNAILFFDEADALFGKRSEVRDSHDRYANIEIGYLLQKMEEYEGVVILATNLRKNMDDAFVRRMHFTIEFPLPNEQDRRRIWEVIWPEQAPRSSDLDLDLMARRFEIAGGNIKNIALAAAFLAAADGQVVTMNHLLHATRREYQKMGKVVAEQDFGGIMRAYHQHLR